MDDITRYYLVVGTFGAVLAIVVTLFAIRTARTAKASRPGFDPDSPDPELIDEIPDDDDSEIEGPTAATENLRHEVPTRVGLSALREADSSVSEPELAADVQALFAAAWTARGAGDLGGLKRRFSDGAAESMLTGRAPLSAVREVLVDAPRLLEASVEEPWARASWELRAIVHGVWGGVTRDFHVIERWSMNRPAAGGSPWVVRAVLDREQEPLARPPLERGREVEPGSSLPTVFAPDLPEARAALLARHPSLDLDAFSRFVPDLFARQQSALDAGDPGALGELVTADLQQAQEYAVARLARTGLRARFQDGSVDRVELCRIDQDARYDLLTVRVHALCRQWLEDEAGVVVDGVADEPRDFSEYWTFVRPRSGESPSARGRQGFALWRIQSDEAYNG